MCIGNSVKCEYYSKMNEFFSSINDYNIVSSELFVEDKRGSSKKRGKQTNNNFAVSTTSTTSEQITELSPTQNGRPSKTKHGNSELPKNSILKTTEYNKPTNESGTDIKAGGLPGHASIPARKHVRFDKLRRLVDMKINRRISYTPRETREPQMLESSQLKSFIAGADYYPEPPTHSHAASVFSEHTDTDGITFLLRDDDNSSENQQTIPGYAEPHKPARIEPNEDVSTAKVDTTTIDHNDDVYDENVVQLDTEEENVVPIVEASALRTATKTDNNRVTSENCVSFTSTENDESSASHLSYSVFSVNTAGNNSYNVSKKIDYIDKSSCQNETSKIHHDMKELDQNSDNNHFLAMTDTLTFSDAQNAKTLNSLDATSDGQLATRTDGIEIEGPSIQADQMNQNTDTQSENTTGINGDSISSSHSNVPSSEPQRKQKHSCGSDKGEGQSTETNKPTGDDSPDLRSDHSKQRKSSKLHDHKAHHLKVSDFLKHRHHDGDTDSLSQHSSTGDSVSGIHLHHRRVRSLHVNPYDLVRDEMRKQARERWRITFKMVRLIKRLADAIIKTDKKGASLQTFTDFATDATYTGNLEGSGLSFDPNYFKANKEITISSEVKHILSTQSCLRSPEQIQTAMFGLQSLKSFAEYPLHMQEKLCKVAWYEVVPSRRVIIRQGHYAENFYFILSGQAVVTIMLQNPKTGESFVKTATVMRKGMSFGELALLHRSRRTATVTSQDTVQLLTIGREDFFDIFMSGHGGIPDHIKFVSNIEFMKDWPIEQLLEYPQYCLLHFFKRNVVIVKDSRVSDWLYVVKSGSCQVLKQLRGVTPKLGMRRDTEIDEIFKLPKVGAAALGPKIDTGIRRIKRSKQDDEEEKENVGNNSFSKDKYTQNPTTQKAHFLSARKKTQENKFLIRKRYQVPKIKRPPTPVEKPADPKQQPVFVQVELLKPRDVFGLERIQFDDDIERPATVVSLVSRGAECIMLNKDFFAKHANESVKKRIRQQLRVYPEESTFQDNLQIKADWELFKVELIDDLTCS